MARSEFDGLSLKQLISMRDRLDAKIEEQRKEDRDDTRRALVELAEKRGFAFSDFVDAAGKKKGSRGPVAIKYRNPDNPSETWTGRGKRPRWLVAKLGKSGRVEQFEV